MSEKYTAYVDLDVKGNDIKISINAPIALWWDDAPFEQLVRIFRDKRREGRARHGDNEPDWHSQEPKVVDIQEAEKMLLPWWAEINFEAFAMNFCDDPDMVHEAIASLRSTLKNLEDTEARMRERNHEKYDGISRIPRSI